MPGTASSWAIWRRYGSASASIVAVSWLDLGGVVVDDRQHHRQHGGVLIGEERALQRFFQPADLAAHGAAGQLGQERLRVALPGGERVQHVPAGDAVDVGDHRRQLQVPVFEQFLHPLLLGGAGLGEVTAVPGVGAQPADRLGRHEAGGDHPPLGDPGEPDRVGPVGLRPAGQGLDLRGVIQVAVEPAGFEQEEHRLPVVASGLHPGLGHAPAAQPVRQVQQLACGWCRTSGSPAGGGPRWCRWAPGW